MRISDTYKMMYEKKDSPPWNTGKQDYAGAAKELRDYAMKDGGIDKKDMLAVASQLASQAKSPSASVGARMMRNIQGLDTDVREKIHSILKKHGLKESLESDLEIVEQMEEIELEEAMVRGKEVYDKTFANRTQADNFAKKNGGYVKQVGRVFYVFKGEPVTETMDEAKSKEQQIADLENMLDRISGNTSSVKMKKVALQRKIDKLKNEGLEEAKRDPSKSGGSGYDLYHKDFSTAMKHAYDYAKKKFGITIDPKEIDDKVASGPRKPSAGKTNTYRLKGDKGSVQIQVANLDNKKYELNMYKEEAYKTPSEVEEAYKTPAEASAYEAGKKAVAKGVSYDDNPNKKGTKEYTAWSKGHNDARARKIARKEEVEMENIEEAEFFKWEVKVGGRSWRGTARNAGEAVKKARPSMGNLDLSKASVKRITEDVNVEEKKLSLQEAIMLSVFGEAKKDEKKDKKAPETDKDDDGEGMDAVDKKALKKDYDDRAKDGDGDIDNDGDEDKTDKYLHKRRQAVTKAISKKKGPESSKKGEPVDTNPTMDEEKGEEMSSAEKEKKDEIIKKLEQRKQEFVNKYGDRATEVMHRTAIKMAKKNA